MDEVLEGLLKDIDDTSRLRAAFNDAIEGIGPSADVVLAVLGLTLVDHVKERGCDKALCMEFFADEWDEPV